MIIFHALPLSSKEYSVEMVRYTNVPVVVFSVTKKKHKFLIVMKAINIMMYNIIALLLMHALEAESVLACLWNVCFFIPRCLLRSQQFDRYLCDA
jgi:hypothetical protein